MGKVEVEISDWQIVQEFRERVANKDIAQVEGGRYWPTHCPKCGGRLTVNGFEVNIPDSAKDWTQQSWDDFDKDNRFKKPYGTPGFFPRKSGKYYCVTCENALCDYGECDAFSWEWHLSHDAALEEFFNHNTEN